MTFFNPCFRKIEYGVALGASADNRVLIEATDGSTRLSSEPVYADDGVNVKYYKNTLDVETIIMEATEDNVKYDGLEGINYNREEQAAIYRKILGTPGLKLKLYPSGVGKFPIINGDLADAAAATANETHTAHIFERDTLGGPFPQNVSVAPIASNEALYVKWSVVFHTRECYNGFLSQPFPIGTLLEYSVEYDIQVDAEGDAVNTFIGTFHSSVPVSDLTTIRLRDYLTNRVIQGGEFEGVHPQSRISRSKDGRLVKFTLTLNPIKSPSAYFPDAHEIRATDKASSSWMEDGFYRWHRTIRATITLRAGLSKARAILIYLRICQAKFKNMKLLLGFDKATAVNRDELQNPNGEVLEQQSRYLPLSFSFEDEIYSRKFTIEAQWVMFTGLEAFIRASNITGIVHTAWIDPTKPNASKPIPRSAQWLQWQLATQYLETGRLNYFTENLPVQFAFCTASTSNIELPKIYVGRGYIDTDPPEDCDYEKIQEQPGTGSPAYPPQPGDPPTESAVTERLPLTYLGDLGAFKDPQRLNCFDPDYPYAYAKENSYALYDVDFSIEEESNIYAVDFLDLSQPSRDYNTASAANLNRNNTGMMLNGQAAPPPSYGDEARKEMVSRSRPRFFIRMIGMAIRYGYKIPMPVITSVGNQAAYRVGNPRFHQKKLGGSEPIYIAKWDVLYTINSEAYAPDILSQIKTNADSSVYV